VEYWHCTAIASGSDFRGTQAQAQAFFDQAGQAQALAGSQSLGLDK